MGLLGHDIYVRETLEYVAFRLLDTPGLFQQPPYRLQRRRGRITGACRQDGGNKRSRIFPGNQSVACPTSIRYGISVSNPRATFVASDSSPTPAWK